MPVVAQCAPASQKSSERKISLAANSNCVHRAAVPARAAESGRADVVVIRNGTGSVFAPFHLQAVGTCHHDQEKQSFELDAAVTTTHPGEPGVPHLKMRRKTIKNKFLAEG